MKAILGGSFDPPHLGHIEMAEAVLKSGHADQVSLMPCFSHNFGKSMTPPKHRLAMCRLCERPGIVVDPFEIKSMLTGGTLALVTALNVENYENTRPTFVIGADNAACFKKWVRYEELLVRAQFIIIPRKGTEISREVRKMFKKHIILDTEITPSSSTLIRDCLEEWWKTLECERSLNKLLNPKVFEYIREHSLYK